MTQPLVTAGNRDGIVDVVLQRPWRHNALVPDLLDELRSALQASVTGGVRALVLAADGPSFSTGGDVAAFRDTPRAGRAAYAERVVGGLNQAILALLRLPVPTVAAVHGMVTGGSLGLVLACDRVIAGPRASFAPWYTRVGFSPDGGWTALLPDRVGSRRALAWQLHNWCVDDAEAEAFGLVDLRCAQGDERAAARREADGLAAGVAGSVRRTLALARPDPAATERALDAERRAFVEQIVTDEADRGMEAFLGGR